MFLILLFLVPFAAARLDLTPFQAEPVVTFCLGAGCPSVSFVETVRETNFSCNGTSESLHPDEKDCHSYYRCENGNATKITCPPGFGFYRLGHTDGYCALDVYVKSCNTIDCTTNGFVPDPMECTRFYVCLHGYPHRFHCPVGTLFNTMAGQCVALRRGVENPCAKDVISTTTPTPAVPPTQEVPSEIKPTTDNDEHHHEITTTHPEENTTVHPEENQSKTTLSNEV